MNIDTTGWAPFNPNDPHDAMCEVERNAFTQYTVKRLQKCAKTGSDQEAIWVGGLMAIVQMAFAIHDNNPPDSARDALHKALDFSWLQCAAMAHDPKGLA